MAATEVADTLAAPRAEPPTRSTWGLAQLSLFWTANNYLWAALPIIIIPSQVQVILFQHLPAGVSGATAIDNYIKGAAPGALALVAGPGLIVALISNPLFGYLSDRTRSRFGRRRPYILVGTLFNMVGLGMMAFANSTLMLMLGLVVVQLANNAAAAPFHALLPDLVPAGQRGKASGYMGLGQMLGTILGGSLPGIVFGVNALNYIDGHTTYASYQHSLYVSYGFTAVFILALAVITVLTVRETPLARDAAIATDTGGARLARDLVLTLAGIGVVTVATIGLLNLVKVDLTSASAQNLVDLPAILLGTIGVAVAFHYRPRQQGDFSWVLLTRALVMMGIYTVELFIQYILQNVTFAGVKNPPSAENAAGYFLDIVIVTAALSTAFAGALSDRLGRKRMVYISGGFMVFVGLLFVIAQLSLQSNPLILVTFVGAAIFGLGYGAYVSVDWALVTDVLKDDRRFARDMGVWNVALTTPQVLAYIISALVIALFATGGLLAGFGHPTFGYQLLFVLLVIYATLGTVTVRFIKGVAR